MAWRAPSWDALAETIDTTSSSEVAALLSRAEAAERERDEALARLSETMKALAPLDDVVAVLGIDDDESVEPADEVRRIIAERDEALAREAVLREALGDIVADMSRRGTVAANTAGAALVRLGVHSAEASAARDAALVERGRREGIEEAARVVEDDMTRRGERLWDHDYLAGRIAEAIRALATPPADGGPR
jgi:hypothetical protein